MRKTTTWTARTKAQLVAALARKGYDRDAIRTAADHAVRFGNWDVTNFAVLDDPQNAAVIITYGDTEVDLWDAKLVSEDELIAHGEREHARRKANARKWAKTWDHAPAVGGTFDSYGDTAEIVSVLGPNVHEFGEDYYVLEYKTPTSDRVHSFGVIVAKPVAGEPSVEITNGVDVLHFNSKGARLLQSIAKGKPAIEAVEAATGPVERGHWVRSTTLNAVVFVLAIETNEMVQVRHNFGDIIASAWVHQTDLSPLTSDEEIAAAVEYSVATGHLVTWEEFKARLDAEDVPAALHDGEERAGDYDQPIGPDHDDVHQVRNLTEYQVASILVDDFNAADTEAEAVELLRAIRANLISAGPIATRAHIDGDGRGRVLDAKIGVVAMLDGTYSLVWSPREVGYDASYWAQKLADEFVKNNTLYR